MGDKTGQLEGRVWDPGDPRIAKDFDRGDIVKARGSVSRFDDRLQMKVEQLRKATPGEADKADLLPATTYDVDALWRSFWAMSRALPSRTSSGWSRRCWAMRNWPRLIARLPRHGSSITPGWEGCWSTW